MPAGRCLCVALTLGKIAWTVLWAVHLQLWTTQALFELVPHAGGDYRSCLLVSTCKNSLLYSWAVRNNSADWVPAGLCLAARVSTFNKQCLQHCSTLSGPFTALAVVRLSACARIGLTAGFDARLVHFAVPNRGLAISGPCHRSWPAHH